MVFAITNVAQMVMDSDKLPDKFPGKQYDFSVTLGLRRDKLPDKFPGKQYAHTL
jgi:hypothetical protein